MGRRRKGRLGGLLDVGMLGRGRWAEQGGGSWGREGGERGRREAKGRWGWWGRWSNKLWGVWGTAGVVLLGTVCTYVCLFGFLGTIRGSSAVCCVESCSVGRGAVCGAVLRTLRLLLGTLRPWSRGTVGPWDLSRRGSACGARPPRGGRATTFYEFWEMK